MVGHERCNNAALTVADEADVAGVYVVAGAEQLDRCFDVGGTVLDRRFQTVARRPADASVVVAQRGDADFSQRIGQHGKHLETRQLRIPQLVTAAADEDNARVRPVAVGQCHFAGEDDVAAGERHFIAAKPRRLGVVCSLQPEDPFRAGLGEFAVDQPIAHFPVPDGLSEGRLQLEVDAPPVERDVDQFESDPALDVHRGEQLVARCRERHCNGQLPEVHDAGEALPATQQLRGDVDVRLGRDGGFG